MNKMTFRRVMAVSVACACALLPMSGLSQNPEWRGRQFRMVFTDGEAAPGTLGPVSATEAVLTGAGVFIFQPNTFTGGTPGVYFLTDDGFEAVASTADPTFQDSLNWLRVGVTDAGGIIFHALPLVERLPVYSWDSTLSIHLPPEESGLNTLHRNGSVTFWNTSGSGININQGAPGATAPVITSDDVPGLAGHLASDGVSIAFQVGQPSQNNAEVWLRNAEGGLLRIIKDGDPLPGGEGTYRGLPDPSTVRVDQGWVYMVAESREADPFNERVLIRSNGVDTEVLLAARNPALGIDGVEVAGFDIGSVFDGELIADVALPNGGFGVFHWESGIWTKVFTTEDSFDGDSPISFTVFPHGQNGDDLLATVTFLGPNFRPTNKLYTTASLPGFSDQEPGPSLTASISINGEDSGSIIFEGKPGSSYRLLTSQNLSEWTQLGEQKVAAETEPLQWDISLFENLGFFAVETVQE